MFLQVLKIGAKLVVRNAGNFMSVMHGSSNVVININVTPQDDLYIENNDVVYNLNISLLDALKGIKTAVPSILGLQEININPASKNKEEILIPKLGVGGLNNQRVILNIQYPDNLDSLINFLSPKDNTESDG